MVDSTRNSVFKMILKAVEESFTITKGVIEISKENLIISIKRLGFGVGFVFTALLLLNVSLLFFLIALAYVFIQIGLASWISFLLVATIMIALAVVFIVLAVRSFSKVKGIGDATRIGRETKKYLKENVTKTEKSSDWNSL